MISKKNTVQSLAKGLKVLAAFDAQEPELTMAEIARRCEVDNATAFRYLNTLVELGYVQKVKDTRRFCLSLKVLELGFAAISHSSLTAIARPLLQNLIGKVNEAASIGVLEGTEIYYIERVQKGLTRLGVDIRIGTRVPVGSTVIGNAILAWLPTAHQHELLTKSATVAKTELSAGYLDSVTEKLSAIRARGYAISDPSSITGFFAMAAPIMGDDQIPLGALSTAAPAIGITLEQFEARSARVVCDAAQQLGLALHSLGSIG